ncbi:hypothetical protein HDU96_004956 [Phlyctochytrium bullatum]|nr:hypothetical protein HDU96_004956 [Phlyctochytrium bullatum]
MFRSSVRALRSVRKAAPPRRNFGLWSRDPFFSDFDRAVSQRLNSVFNDFERLTRAIAEPQGSNAAKLTSSQPGGALSPISESWPLTWTRLGNPLTLDLKETDKQYIIHVEVPGVAKEEMSVTVKDGILTIEGEKKAESKSDDDKRHVSERIYGKFTRSVRLPPDADENSVSAKLNNGVLELSLQKKEIPPEQAPKKINVE